jgi:hypothetical protein
MDPIFLTTTPFSLESTGKVLFPSMTWPDRIWIQSVHSCQSVHLKNNDNVSIIQAGVSYVDVTDLGTSNMPFPASGLWPDKGILIPSVDGTYSMVGLDISFEPVTVWKARMYFLSDIPHHDEKARKMIDWLSREGSGTRCTP